MLPLNKILTRTNISRSNVAPTCWRKHFSEWKVRATANINAGINLECKATWEPCEKHKSVITVLFNVIWLTLTRFNVLLLKPSICPWGTCNRWQLPDPWLFWVASSRFKHLRSEWAALSFGLLFFFFFLDRVCPWRVPLIPPISIRLPQTQFWAHSVN